MRLVRTGAYPDYTGFDEIWEIQCVLNVAADTVVVACVGSMHTKCAYMCTKITE